MLVRFCCCFLFDNKLTCISIISTIDLFYILSSSYTVGIQIKCVGKSYTHWTESEGSGNSRSSVDYITNHEYFKQEITLQGAGEWWAIIRLVGVCSHEELDTLGVFIL